jgi:excisionase family DNA binding protein
MDLPKMLTSAEVRDILGVSRPTLRVLIESGQLPASKVGAHYRFDPREVDRYLLRGRVGAA